jgi:ketosteroid isomerase-like protein
VNPKDVADRYFAAIRARNIDELMGLYAEDATFILPNGTEARGIAAIRKTHESVFAASSPVPMPQAFVVSDSSVAVEIEARLPDGSSRRTANIYHLDSQGRIQRLSVYTRSG